jgi:hypothetical protein
LKKWADPGIAELHHSSTKTSGRSTEPLWWKPGNRRVPGLAQIIFCLEWLNALFWGTAAVSFPVPGIGATSSGLMAVYLLLPAAVTYPMIGRRRSWWA